MFKIPLKQLILLFSITNLVIASSLGHYIIYQYVSFIVIASIIFVSETIRIKEVKDSMLKRIVNVINAISKIAFLVGFFILTVNVFVLQVGEKSCDRCVVASTGTIIGAAVYLVFYFIFFWVSMGESYGKLIVENV